MSLFNLILTGGSRVDKFSGGMIELGEADEIMEKLEAKRNRTEKRAQVVTVQSLNRALRHVIGTVVGAKIERELDQRFRKAYRLRMKG